MKYDWRHDNSENDAYLYLQSGLYLEIRRNSFARNEWQATIWLKQHDKRSEVAAWDYIAYSLDIAKRIGLKRLKEWVKQLYEGLNDE